MKKSQCAVCIPVPWWTDRAIAAGCILFSFVIIFICYIRQEAERHRTFYGREDKMTDSERKNAEEMEAAALGECADDIFVRKDLQPDSKVQVMVVPHRKKPVTPIQPQSSPRKVVVASSPDSPYKLVLQVMMDKMGRAEELLTELKKEAVPHGIKVAETVVEYVQEILERMTRKCYMVVGLIAGEQKKRVIRGEEHFHDGGEELTIQMKLKLVQPLEVEIKVYQFEVAEAKLEPVPEGQTQAPQVKVEDEIQTDVTPQQTPMKSKLSSRRPVKTETPHKKPTSSVLGSAVSKNHKQDSLPPIPPGPSSPMRPSSSKMSQRKKTAVQTPKQRPKDSVKIRNTSRINSQPNSRERLSQIKNGEQLIKESAKSTVVTAPTFPSRPISLPPGSLEERIPRE